MASLNRVELIGNLGNDPEFRVLPSGQKVAHFSLATTDTYKKDEEKIEETEWHRITVWGPLAVNCDKYLQKGSGVWLEGRIKQSEYTDKEGVKRPSFEIIANNVQFLSRTKGKAGAEPKGDGAPSPAGEPEVAF